MLSGTMANASAPLLLSKSVNFSFDSDAGIFRIGFIYKSNSFKDNTSLDNVNSAIYSVSLVSIVISVWRRLAQMIGQPTYCITNPVLDCTEFGSSLVSEYSCLQSLH